MPSTQAMALEGTFLKYIAVPRNDELKAISKERKLDAAGMIVAAACRILFTVCTFGERRSSAFVAPRENLGLYSLYMSVFVGFVA